MAQKNVFYVNKDFTSEEEVVNDDDDMDVYSLVSIDHVYLENHLEFGSEINIKIKFINKGNKDNLLLFVIDEDENIISNKINFEVFKNSNAVITQKISIDKNCFGDSNATIVINAFGVENKRKIKLSCPNPVFPETENKSNNESMDFSAIETTIITPEKSKLFEILNFTSNSPLDFPLHYMGKSRRALNYLPQIIVFSLAMVAIVFFKNKL